MSKSFIAHIRENDGTEQMIEEHCEAVRSLAESFAIDEFKSLVAYSGHIHDIGKFRDGFQARIRGTSNKPCEHACCAAQEISKHRGDSQDFVTFVPMLEYCTAQSGYRFGLFGHPEKLLHDDEELLAKYSASIAENSDDGAEKVFAR